MPKNLTIQTQTGATYIGGGNFVEGVPARDLTPSEWGALDVNTQALLKDLNLYQPNTQTDPAPADQAG